jgi:hypothetical protein
VERQVPQAGVLRITDAVLATRSSPVPELQVGEPAAAGVGDEHGESMPVQIGEPQLRAGMRALPADDYPHPLRPAGQVQHSGEFGDPRTSRTCRSAS